MNILITGSLGHLGSSLTKELINRGHNVFGLDLSHSENEHAFTMGFSVPQSYFRCDIGEYRQIRKVLEYTKPDIVFHAAAEFGRWNGEDFYENVWQTNVIGTKNILRIQQDLGFKLVHFSSSEIYGNYQGIMSENAPETVAMQQLNDYALSKWVNELQIRNSSTKRDCVILRLFNVFGPGEHYSPYRSYICRLLYSCLNSIEFAVFKGHSRTNIYIDDAIRAVSNLADPSIYDYSKFHGIYNIGNTEKINTESAAELALSLTGANRDIIRWVDHEPMTTVHKNIDNSAAADRLQLLISVSLEEGMKKTLNWMNRYYSSEINNEQNK